ncbi:hypothetical protein VNO77_25571 [Canavalia gladiata]|uniref:Uncharacterized protein n=1 Tax=Canavalia gladiata TaxID=3824 RepID=A0AAN9LBS4_CANGL
MLNILTLFQVAFKESFDSCPPFELQNLYGNKHAIPPCTYATIMHVMVKRVYDPSKKYVGAPSSVGIFISCSVLQRDSSHRLALIERLCAYQIESLVTVALILWPTTLPLRTGRNTRLGCIA